MFNELFKGTPKFDYNSQGNKFVNINEFLADHDKTLTYQVKGMFTTDGKWGKRGVIVIDGYNINVPSYMVERIEGIRANADMVAAINAGHCGLKFRDYEDKKNGNVIRTAVDLCDYAPTDEPTEVLEF